MTTADGKEKILVVSWTLPPALRGSAVVINNLSSQFSPSEMILAGDSWPGSSTYRRDAGLPSIHHVGSHWTWPPRGGRFVHWIKWFLLPPTVLRLHRTARRKECTRVLAVFPNEFYLLAAYLVARWRRIVLYPYLHNTYVENRRGIARRLAEWLQPRVFALSPVVFVVTGGMREYYLDHYEGTRFELLSHSFNGDLPNLSEIPKVHSPLQIAFLGNLNHSNLDAMGRFSEVVRAFPRCHMTVYSENPARVLIQAGLVGECFETVTVESKDLIAALQKHDILFLPHGFKGGLSQVEYDTIFPTRTITYLLSGRPILAHSPPDSFLTRWLREHDCAEVVDRSNREMLGKALERLRCDDVRRKQLVGNALKAARQFHAPVVAARFRELLGETSMGHGGCKGEQLRSLHGSQSP